MSNRHHIRKQSLTALNAVPQVVNSNPAGSSNSNNGIVTMANQAQDGGVSSMTATPYNSTASLFRFHGSRQNGFEGFDGSMKNADGGHRDLSANSAGKDDAHRGSESSGGQRYGEDGDDGEGSGSPESSRGMGFMGLPFDSGDGTSGVVQGMDVNRQSLEDGGGGGDDGQPQPSWSELKTKAGKERKRLPLACIACRRKKIRCSGQKPACRHCLRSRIPCVYKVTTRKAAPRTDYMAMLDKRLKRMEERIIKIIPKEELSEALSTGRASVKPTASVTTGGATGGRAATGRKRTANEAFRDEIEHWANTGQNRHSQARTQQEQSKQDALIYGQRRRTDLEENVLYYEGAEYLPSPEIQEHLAEVYFDYVYGQTYHLLHKPSFMRKLRSGKVPPVLVLAVCGVAARFSNHPQVVHDPPFLAGGQWARPAIEIALKRYYETNITLLTVLLLMCLHEFGTCQGGSSWMLGGMAIRMGYTLQLHRELFHDPVKSKQFEGLSATDKEIRRRTIWACFMMDGFTASGSERPMFMNEDDIEVQLPIREQHFFLEIPGITEGLNGKPMKSSSTASEGTLAGDPKGNMGAGAYMIRIVALWRKVTKYLNLGGKDKDPYPFWSHESRFRVLKDRLANFKANLPKSLLYTRENLSAHAADRIANQFFFLHIAYHQSVLFLHRFAIPTTPGARTPKDMPMQFVKDSALVTLSAAKAISTIINDTAAYFVVAPFIGYCVFASSTVHVIGTFSKNPALEASSKKYLAYNVKYLSKMKRHWGMFHFMIENLKDLYRKHADYSRNGASPTLSKSKDGDSADDDNQTHILQYGDWFRHYPRGVSATDFEDPAEDQNSMGGEAALGQKSDLLSVEEFFASLSASVKQEQDLKEQQQIRQKVTLSNKRQSGTYTRHQTQQTHAQQSQGQAPHPPLQPPPPPATRSSVATEAALQDFSIPSPAQLLNHTPLPTGPTAGSPLTLPSPSTNMYPHNLHPSPLYHTTPPHSVGSAGNTPSTYLNLPLLAASSPQQGSEGVTIDQNNHSQDTALYDFHVAGAAEVGVDLNGCMWDIDGSLLGTDFLGDVGMGMGVGGNSGVAWGWGMNMSPVGGYGFNGRAGDSANNADGGADAVG